MDGTLTPTGGVYTTLTFSTQSAVLDLATNSGSTPPATKVRITNLGGTNSPPIFVTLGGPAVGASTEGVPILSNQTVVLGLGSFTNVAIMLAAAGSTTSVGVSVVTGY